MPANQLTVPPLMILALQNDTSRHDAGRSLYGRSKARLPTGPASWPTRQGTCPIMVLRARSGRWWLPTSWPAWPAYSDQAPPEGTEWTPLNGLGVPEWRVLNTTRGRRPWVRLARSV